MRNDDATPAKAEVIRAIDELIEHGRGEILIVITPGNVDILAGKRNRFSFSKALDKSRDTD